MRIRLVSVRGWIGAAAAALALALSLAASAREAPRGSAQPRDPDRAALRQVCGRCHNVEVVLDTVKSADEWQDTVQTMVDRGARGTDAQFDAIMRYLAANATTINVNTADAEDLEAVLGVSPKVSAAMLNRRHARRFASLADLESVPGVDPRQIEAKRKRIFF